MAQKPITKVTSPKSCVSTNSTIPAYMSGRRNCRYFLLFGTARDQDEAQICYLCLCSILSVMLPSLLIFLVALIIEPSGWLNILVTRAVHLPAKVSVFSGVILGNAGKLLFCCLSFPIGISSCKFIHLQKSSLRWHHLNLACLPIPSQARIQLLICPENRLFRCFRDSRICCLKFEFCEKWTKSTCV